METVMINNVENSNGICYNIVNKGRCSKKTCKYDHPCPCDNINKNGQCLNKDKKCIFAHPPVCKNIKEKGYCTYKQCLFAHPIVCLTRLNRRICPYGEKCKFVHPSFEQSLSDSVINSYKQQINLLENELNRLKSSQDSCTNSSSDSDNDISF